MRDRKKRSTGARGFSLVETLIAATIVIVALAGLAQLFVIAVAANQRAKSRTVATVLAQEKLEELMAIDGEVISGTDFIDGRGQWIGAGALPPPGTVYVRRWIAEPMPATFGASLLQVSVTLTSQMGGGEAAQIVSVKTSRISWR
jgi:Tfp pilus assembly protein PilV